MEKNVVLYIDEEQIALDSYGRELRKNLPPELEIICTLPEPTLPLMLKFICSMRPRIASIVVDEHLEVAGTADYIGSQLADAYRQLDSKIPIYILSNHPDEIDDNLESVEYILSKDDFADGGPALESAITRMVRHINAYEQIVDEREQRFVLLLKKYVLSEISTEEAKELNELKFWREAPAAIEESTMTLELKRKLDEQEDILNNIEQILSGKK
ncbi:hypothetical protein K7459_11510 [Pseudomonas fluorescens]|uniref:Uncharacterized protein n=1 Tax=Pseudomonas fluorescens (strain Pf0-1) TaxID=205922 RepID=Q3K791_PSEPF|nr:hypothetical protein [Pseudomonas fluorescens]ABA76363.1 hypothetical protein Pfl01_4626 [Pseudomonas fluorescens Pf0-1]MBY9024291.1 hypothetical protein [Pseudomonas fluorescens]MBY9030604.1 hypothetical protein [Pseudomonas fluorescens]MBY9035792.1 hypothetical protein [Pseudomonas fluorescens]MBY9042494.1 hypothetical protein [Pseudomonas fluorescens]